MNDQYVSSHAIIKALKGPADPPTPNGPSKIEIASNAWRSQDVYFPGRSEVLVDWILNSFLRKTKSDEGSTLLSPEFWALLDSILSDSKTKPGSTTWLSSIVGKLPFATITQNLAQSFPKLIALGDDGQLSNILACFEILWPLASRRMNVDSLADCFTSTVLGLSSDRSQALHSNTKVMAISYTVAKTFRLSLSNSASKKKVLANFLQKVLKPWVEIMASKSSVNLQDDEICLAGVDVLFSVDSLKSSNVLQDVLEAITSESLGVLPCVYISYLDAARRHRFAIYGTTSANNSEQAIQTNLSNATMESFALVHKVIQVHDTLPEAWRCLLKIVLALEEKLPTGTSGNQVLSNVASHSLHILTPGSEVYGPEIQDVALETLHVLARIDFDVVAPLMPMIFSSLARLTTEQIPSSLKLLSVLLGFHAKTRTLPSYIAVVLDCLAPSDSEAERVNSSTETYCSVSASPLLDGAHLRELSTSLKTFLTPGQVLTLTKSTLESVRNAWARYEGQKSNEAMEVDGEAPKKKKRRKDDKPGNAQAAISFACAARIASVVFTSLLLDSLTSADRESVFASAQSARHDLFAITRRVAEGQDPLEWTKQLVTSSAFRLIHAISANSKLRTGMKIDAKVDDLDQVMISKLRNEGVSAELVIETLRQFFDSVEAGHTSPSNISANEAMDIVLHYMNLGVEQAASGERGWDGRSYSMDAEKGHYGGAVAVWSLALHRWLYIIDEMASESQLDAFADLIFRSLASASSREKGSSRLSICSELQRAIHSGHFWEMSNLRAAIERIVERRLQPLDKPSLEKLFKKVVAKERVKASGVSLQTIIPTFRFLLQAPPEYLTRTSRQNITRRAIAADITISTASIEHSITGDEAQLALRRWIRSHIDASSTEIDWVEFATYLSQPAHPTGFAGFLEELSLELIVDVVRIVFRGADKAHQDDAKLLLLLNSYAEQVEKDAFRRRVVCRIFDYMTAEGPPLKTLSEEIVKILRNIHQRMAEIVAQEASRLPMLLVGGNKMMAVQHLRTLKSMLAMGSYLGTSDVSSSLCNDAFFRNIVFLIRESRYDELLVQAFGFTVELFLSTGAPSKSNDIDRVVAAYVHVFDRVADISKADEVVRKLSRSLAESDYTHALGSLKEALAADHTKVGTAGIIHLSRVISTNGPEGTSKETHELLQDSMRIFLSDPTILFCETSCLNALELIQAHCTERPIFLTNLDVGTIFTVLSRVLSQSPSHSSISHPEILHAVVGVANSVLRYRRDLVTSTLPHLGMVLRLLILSLRTARQDLGAKQAKQVNDSLPWWTSPSSQPLGAGEARAVARLLTTLQAKTIPSIRMHSEQKAESLSRPFSKHAPYVLTAYIDAMNDPLCSIPLPVRKELEPGLFALCDIMTEHGRDAIMVSTRDSGGKAALKSLWKEYEKQRYVGKG